MNRENINQTTIGEIQDIFIKLGHEHFVNKGIVTTFKLLRQNSSYNTLINNDSYLDALMLTEGMFSITNNNLRILTGGASDVSFFDVLKDSLKSALERITSNSGIAKIIVLDGMIPKELKKLQSEYNVLKIAKGRKKNNISIGHMIVADSMVREEIEHEPINLKSKANLINAKIYPNNEPLASIKRNLFDSYWKVVTQ